jgi:hypothetical protein
VLLRVWSAWTSSTWTGRNGQRHRRFAGRDLTRISVSSFTKAEASSRPHTWPAGIAQYAAERTLDLDRRPWEYEMLRRYAFILAEVTCHTVSVRGRGRTARSRTRLVKDGFPTELTQYFRQLFPGELRERDLGDQTLEHTASPSEAPVVPLAVKILLNPGQP